MTSIAWLCPTEVPFGVKRPMMTVIKRKKTTNRVKYKLFNFLSKVQIICFVLYFFFNQYHWLNSYVTSSYSFAPHHFSVKYLLLTWISSTVNVCKVKSLFSSWIVASVSGANFFYFCLFCLASLFFGWLMTIRQALETREVASRDQANYLKKARS